jgi:hydrogenase maturation protein HypF
MRSEQEGIPAMGVQHHHANVVSCMAEHGIETDTRVIGFSFDGTGYGDDGAVWGGEVLLAGYREYERAYHFAYCPLPGGDQAVREPWRYALAWLKAAGIEWVDDLAPVATSSSEARGVIAQQLEAGINAPLTSSVGRLFDAVSSLVGCCHSVNYEAQAAIELEALVDRKEKKVYSLRIEGDQIDPVPMFREIVADLRDGTPVGRISARFHNGLASVVQQVSRELRAEHGIEQVVLSGGVWQNMTLLEQTVTRLRADGFDVLVHRKVPSNDGGLALGQALVAAHTIEMS